ncbi:MAG TPA: ATP-binding protein [Gemmatimonadales bacterium]|nr:ATP-binding protein [Gemmatimonadales bacterium]
MDRTHPLENAAPGPGGAPTAPSGEGAPPDDLARLHALTIHLASTLDLTEVLDAVLHAAAELQGTTTAAITLYDPERRDLRLAASIGLPKDWRGRLARLPIGPGTACGIVAAERRPVIIEDTRSDPRVGPPAGPRRPAALRAVYCTPLFARSGELLGTLATHFDRPRRPSGREIRLMELYADQAAHAIENVGLYDALRSPEDRLRRQAESLGLAQRAAGAGVWDWHMAEGRLEWSPEYYELYGIDPAERPTLEAWFESMHPDDRDAARRVTEQAVKERRPHVSVEFRILRGGKVRWMHATGDVYYDAAGTAVRMVGTTIDVTDRRETEEQLRQAAKLESLGRLAGGLAHDLNNQLHAVAGFARLIEFDQGLGPTARQDLHQIEKAAEGMARLTRQLLAFSRRQTLTPELLELNASVAEVKPLIQRLIGADVEMSLAPAPRPLWVEVDRSQLLQVLMNLAINARDAMPRGGTLTIRTGERTVPAPDGIPARVAPGAYAAIEVSDSGAGISPEHMAHIFEPFFTTKQPGEGTGLGLATVHGIVTQSRGYVWAESRAGSGTTFTALLPLAQPPASVPAGATPAATAPAAAPDRDGKARRGRVLVVDDEDVVRTLVRRTLEGEGYEVVTARNGQEALDQLAQSGAGVDAVLSDIIMPVMGGRELSERLAAEHPQVPVAWMSGYPRDAAFLGGELDAAQPFLQKPMSVEAVTQVLDRLLGARFLP